jgi:EAL domain-containing protein (putative c-di-GMP-specific phosphodiesterase class I)
LAINVSAIQLRDRGFVDGIRDSLRRNRVEPSRLMVEITETVFMGEDEAVIASLNGLREIGIRIALDDFGTGYSALGYLHRFRFDRIKLDQMFLNGSAAETTNAAIARAVLGLGRDLGIPVVAEGIETDAQLEFLIENGCSYAQGYLFGRPAPL